jgi:hypothetical protein
MATDKDEALYSLYTPHQVLKYIYGKTIMATDKGEALYSLYTPHQLL